jgi:hypothetical protein
MRCAAGLQTATTTPTSLRGPELTAAASHRIVLREVGIFNTTTTAFAVGLQRITATGTAGAAATETCLEDDSYTPAATVTGVNSTDATAAGGPVRYGSLGAAIGSGVIWTFGDQGLWIPAGTANGIQIMIPTGTAPSATAIQCYFEWDE